MDPIFYECKDIRCRIKALEDQWFTSNDDLRKRRIKKGAVFMGQTAAIGPNPKNATEYKCLQS